MVFLIIAIVLLIGIEIFRRRNSARSPKNLNQRMEAWLGNGSAANLNQSQSSEILKSRSGMRVERAPLSLVNWSPRSNTLYIPRSIHMKEMANLNQAESSEMVNRIKSAINSGSWKHDRLAHAFYKRFINAVGGNTTYKGG